MMHDSCLLIHLEYVKRSQLRITSNDECFLAFISFSLFKISPFKTFFNFKHIKTCSKRCFSLNGVLTDIFYFVLIDIFTFLTLNHQSFSLLVVDKNKSNTNTGGSLSLNPPPNFSLSFSEYNYLTSH